MNNFTPVYSNENRIHVMMSPNDLRRLIGMQPHVNNCDTCIKEDDVKRIVDKGTERED